MTKKKAVTEVVVQRSAELTAQMAQDASHGFEGDTEDIIIPKLLIGQSTSKPVQNEEIAFGQIWRATDVRGIGGRGEPIKIVPLTHFKYWIVSKKVYDKFEFCRIDPFKAGESLDWTFVEDGAEMKREKALNFYCLLADDIDKDIEARANFAEKGVLPDAEDALFPCLLQFKSTAYKEGRKLVTHFAKAADFGAPPYVSSFDIDTEKVQNDKGSWFVFKLGSSSKTADRHGAACSKWMNIVKNQNNVKIDESDLEETYEATASGGPSQF